MVSETGNSGTGAENLERVNLPFLANLFVQNS